MAFNANVPKTYEGTIANDGWYPDLDIAEFMASYRQDTRLEKDLIEAALVDAMIVVHADLADWKAQKVDSGFLSLAAVPADTIKEQSVYVLMYQTAVYSRAKAELLHDFPDYSLTPAGQNLAEDKSNNAGYYYAQSVKSIRRIKGKHGTRVKLVMGKVFGNPWESY